MPSLPRWARPWVLVAALALAASLCAGDLARALPGDSCGPCAAGLLDVGPGWRVHFVAGREAHEGDGDRPASVSVYRVAEGQCCLARTKADYPGAYLYALDPARHRLYLVGHDARWAALATNGIWSYDLATGEVANVAARVWNDVVCRANPLRVAAILQSDPPPPLSKGPRAAPPEVPSDPYAGTFRLVVLDLAADRPARFPVATRRSLGAFDAAFDMDQFAETFHWSSDCTVLTYALAPGAPRKTFRVPPSRGK